MTPDPQAPPATLRRGNGKFRPHRASRWGAALFLCAAIATAQTVDTARVVWQHPQVQGSTQTAGPLLDALRHEIQQILDRPPLAPMQLNYGDIEGNGYTIFNEPGRILLTLAWAYPHLSTAQQAAVRSYATNEIAQTARMPWGGPQSWENYFIPRTNGAPREHHPRDRNWNTVAAFGSKRPTLFVLYGFWLYGHRTGDWAPVTNVYDQLANTYFNRINQPGQESLYGTLGAHIGMARLAAKVGDTATRNEAITNLHAALEQALDFTATSLPARVRLVGTNTYAVWAAANIPDPDSRWWSDDADGDSIANALAYALDPELALTLANGTPALAFRLNSDAGSEFDIAIEASDNLLTWSPQWSWHTSPPYPPEELSRTEGSLVGLLVRGATPTGTTHYLRFKGTERR